MITATKSADRHIDAAVDFVLQYVVNFFICILQKPFFISVEVGRDTFVSGELEIWKEEVGRYGSPPPGRVALDNPALISIHCNQKVKHLLLSYMKQI